MRGLALLLLLFIPSLASAETWRVWIYPQSHTSIDHVLTRPRTLQYKEFKIGVEETSKALQRYCNLQLKVVDDWRQADIIVAAHHPDTYTPMWSARYGHVAGRYVYFRPDYVMISTGWLPARTVPGNQGYYWHFVKDQKGLSGLICHEFGHNQKIMGPSHEYNLSSVFGTPPRGLVDKLVDRFGKPPKARMMMEEELQGEPWFPNNKFE